MKDNVEKLKDEHWKTIIQECNRVTDNGEMTKKEWLKTNNIPEATFYAKQKQLRNQIATDLLIQNADVKVNDELIISSPIKEIEFAEIKSSMAQIINSTVTA